MPHVDDGVLAVVERLIDVLEPSGVPYAFGGAIALAAWSEPRATADVDLIVWVDESALDRVVALVRSAGVDVDDRAARTAVAQRGMFAGRAGATRVDVFVPRRSLVEMLGEDERIASWDAICSRA